jgi:hypothetical protein
LKELIDLIIANAAYYRIKLEDSAIRLHAEDLADLPIEQVRRVYAEIRRDPKIKTMPYPSEIRFRIQPIVSDEDEAREIAATAIGSVVKFGYNNPTEARAAIGEIGWEVIDRLGGWTTFCGGLTDQNLNSYQAQIRDLAGSHLKRNQGARHVLELSDSNKNLLPESRGEMRSMQEMLALVKPKGA